MDTTSPQRRLFDAIDSNDPLAVQAALNEGASVDRPDADRWLPCAKAAALGRAQCLKALIDAGADLECACPEGHSLLSLAALAGSRACMEMLLDQASGVSLSRHHFLAGRCAQDGHLDCLDFLAQRGCPMDAPNGIGATPLIRAAESGRFECLLFLLDRGARVDAQILSGESALMMACSYGRAECARLLIERGALVDLAANDGETCAMRASAHRRHECLALLASAGADLGAFSNHGVSAACVGALMKDCQTLEILLQAGADPSARAAKSPPP